MKDQKKTYQLLVEHAKQTRLLESISSLLHWDQETYMPKQGINVRSLQLEHMAQIHHKSKTSTRFATLLSKLINLETGKIKENGFSLIEERNLLRWRRDYLLAKSLPTSFVKALAKLSSEALVAWTKARADNDFSAFAPYLEKIVDLNRKKAEYLGYKQHPYDALIDLHEPEMTVAKLDPLFADLAKELSAILKKIKQAPQVEHKFLFGEFPQAKQMSFAGHLLEAIGYDLTCGRLDLSTHPFSIAMHPKDSRITTRIHEHSLYDSISSTLHEAGHGFYEMGLSPEEYGTPHAESLSLGMHESQSRFWETFLGQSKPFWEFFFPQLQKHYHGKLGFITLEQFYPAINKVAPSFIRVESDEVTYNFHVLLRYEIEKAMIEEKLAIKDLPDAWNAKMQEYLGITPQTNKEGCLQDIHWSMGELGYFPTYTIGNLYGGQIFQAFTTTHPDWASRVSSGQFAFILAFLKDKIHQHGRTYTSEELLKQATGHPLTATPYLTYLRTKYSSIYK